MVLSEPFSCYAAETSETGTATAYIVILDSYTRTSTTHRVAMASYVRNLTSHVVDTAVHSCPFDPAKADYEKISKLFLFSASKDELFPTILNTKKIT